MGDRSKRQVNFEILRVLVMFFIVVWHFIVHGLNYGDAPAGVDFTSTVSVVNYLLMRYIAAITAVAVDCYVLISGYFLITSTQMRWDKILQIWVQKLAYVVPIMLVFATCFHEKVGVGTFLFNLLPVGQYWFITMYMGLMVLAPFLGVMAGAMDKKQYRWCLVCLALLVLTFTFGIFYVGKVQLLFYLFLFLVGGYIRLYNPFARYRAHFGKLFLLACLVLSVMQVTIANAHLVFPWFPFGNRARMLISNSCLTFFTSVLCFLWAKHKVFADNAFMRWVVRLAPYTLGVYLFHDNDWTRRMIWSVVSAGDHRHSWEFLPMMIGVSVVVFFCGVAIDFLRTKVFAWLRINERIHRLCHKGD